jgi:uncharacterized protein (TIGR04255 family)
MEKYIPEIQELMRKTEYPDYALEQSNNIIFDSIRTQPMKTETQNVWSFNDIAKRNGFVLNLSSLIYHTSEYKTFDNFKNGLLKGISLLHDTVKLGFVQRVGMRYINIISPINNEPIGSYLERIDSGINNSDEEGFLIFESALAKRIENGVLVAKTSVLPNVPQFIMPNDLMPLKLSPPDAALNEERLTRALLDLDYYTEERFDFDVAILEKKLIFAHEQIERAFSSAVTKEALEKWR